MAGRVEGRRPRRKQEIDNNTELLRTLEIVQSGGLWPQTQHHVTPEERNGQMHFSVDDKANKTLKHDIIPEELHKVTTGGH